jgi:hypothetical protein
MVFPHQKNTTTNCALIIVLFACLCPLAKKTKLVIFFKNILKHFAKKKDNEQLCICFHPFFFLSLLPPHGDDSDELCAHHHLPFFKKILFFGKKEENNDKLCAYRHPFICLYVPIQ